MAKKTESKSGGASAKKSWSVGLTPEMVAKQEAFYNVRVMHPAMERLLEDFRPLLMPHSESNIIVLTGATGSGKTTLSKLILKALAEEFTELMEADAGTMPHIFVEAYANGDRRVGFKGLFSNMLKQLQEPAANAKTPAVLKDNVLKMVPSARATTLGLRLCVEDALKNRKTRVSVIDEAANLLRFEKDAEPIRVLKSLSNTTGTKWVLVGSFDLFDLIEGGEIARRTTILNLERYMEDSAEDRRSFENVVRALQSRWTCEEVPNFAAVSDELMKVSFGCVGLLKSVLMDASALQLRNDGVWKPSFLLKAVKSFKLRDLIRREIEAGEEKVRDALYGKPAWSPQQFDDIAKKMETACA